MIKTMFWNYTISIFSNGVLFGSLFLGSHYLNLSLYILSISWITAYCLGSSKFWLPGSEKKGWAFFISSKNQLILKKWSWPGSGFIFIRVNPGSGCWSGSAIKRNGSFKHYCVKFWKDFRLKNKESCLSLIMLKETDSERNKFRILFNQTRCSNNITKDSKTGQFFYLTWY